MEDQRNSSNKEHIFANQATQEDKNEANCATSAFFTDKMFRSHQDLIDWVQNIGRSLGYIIVIKRSKTGSSGAISKVILMCDRGGTYRSSKKSSIRNSRTKKTNCPFELAGKYSTRSDSWTLSVRCEKHNHEPAPPHMEDHPYAMRLSDKEVRLVEDLSKKNVKPLDILSTLKEQNTNNVSTLKTIYNARQKFRTTEHTRKTYINQFPDMFHPYITQIQDVKSDGNCEFRAIAVCLGLHEDEWPTIRHNLIDELDMYKTEYEDMFGSEHRLQLYNRLNFSQTEISESLEHRITLSDIGFLIASRYNVILHCLSRRNSMTYLPLRSSPPAWFQHVAIVIGQTDDNHYVKVTLQEGYPMPTIEPRWFRFRHACAAAWITPYIDRINMYVENYHPNCSYYKLL